MKKLLLILITITLSSTSYAQAEHLKIEVLNKWYILEQVDDFGDAVDKVQVIGNTASNEDIAYLMLKSKGGTTIEIYITDKSARSSYDKGDIFSLYQHEVTLKYKAPDDKVYEFKKPIKDNSIKIPTGHPIDKSIPCQSPNS